ncbi:MAG: DUF2905 domain-containing protein [Candidatus Omnitrophota bacterium]
MSGKALIVFGAVLICLGVLLTVAHKCPLFGKFPGDVLIRKNNFTLYFPFATSLIASVILSLVFWLWSRR